MMNRNSNDYYQMFKTAESTIEELKSNTILLDSGLIQISNQVLDEGFHFIKNKYDVKVNNEGLVGEEKIYLIRIEIKQENPTLNYILYSPITDDEEGKDQKHTYEELIIEPWEVLE